jgi:hypothetical protein
VTSFHRIAVRTLLTAIGAGAALVASADVANWSVSRVSHTTIVPPGGVTIQELSGVTYVGPVGGNHRFLAVEETHQALAQFDLAFDAGGAITGVSNVTTIPMTFGADFEGIAYTNPTRNSVFMSEESNPGIREIRLSDAANFGLTLPPAVFTNDRPNLSLESLARAPDGSVMWTANEAALTVDGPVPTPTAGSVVRLLKFNVAGNTLNAGPQFAYVVDPIHGSSTLGSPQNGLSDLVAMPDGTLLALERSVAVATPVYLNKIYETNFASATDVSVGSWANGFTLSGQPYTPATKQLLWSGAVDAASGQNMEGLTLGPRLANGKWVLVGVVDNGSGSDPLSLNTVVSFTAAATTTADFNASGDADGADFLAWQRGFGKAIGAALADGDGDRDGDVDGGDLALWRAVFSTATTPAVPEPAARVPICLAAVLATTVSRRQRVRQANCP